MKLEITRDFYMPDYDGERTKCSDFITSFQDTTLPRDQESSKYGKLKYMTQLQRVANKETETINIELEDMKEFFESQADQGFLDRIRQNTNRYLSIFAQVFDSNMPQPTVEFNPEDQTTFEVLMQQRRQNNAQAHSQMVSQGLTKPGDSLINHGIPPELERTYAIQITPGRNAKKNFIRMREIKANSVGGMVAIKGIVTRCSDVKPCIQVAVYACDACGFEVYQTVSSKTFTPMIECPSQKCIKNMVKGQLILQIKHSRFVSYQEIKIQEPSNEVPIGHVPRQIKVIARGRVTRQCSPGDIVQITGVYMPSPFTGFQAMAAGLTHDTHIEAYQIIKDKINFREFMLSNKMMEKVDELRDSKTDELELFQRFAKSICPEIFGMEEVKQALLLLMIGGVTKEMKDGMKIRGTINALLMGDPGVAKSQFLKHISGFAPRGIYTTGKGSSGVGLTAAVLKDPNTGEVVLEGGALVLADTGICCIDEFDKMDERDRTNIHEVMEQQTISIAKAGITTSLNARTSILAAANPVYGRYNKKLSPHENINLPAALLSRFDLIFLLLDKANNAIDKQLAMHVTQVHQTLNAPQHSEVAIDQEVMRSYIAYAQSFKPTIPADLHNYIVARYVEKRKFQKEGKDEVSYTYITPRTLLAIIRIGQAMAKFNFRDIVNQQDIDSAIKLMDFSFRTLENIHNEEGDGASRRQQGRSNQTTQDLMSTIMNDVRSLFTVNNAKSMNEAEIHKRLQRANPGRYNQRNFTKDNLTETLLYYQKLCVTYIDPDQNVVIL